MNFQLFYFFCIFLIAASPFSAFAENCDSALRPTVFSSSSEYHSDWRVLKTLTKEEYKDQASSSKANAYIVGIPFGASHSSFKKNMTRYESIYKESLTKNELQNIYWTGITQDNRISYLACLEKNSFGLTLAPRLSTTAAVEMVLSYQNPDLQARPLKISWRGDVAGISLPLEIGNGQKINIVASRPEQGAERLISVFGGKVSQSLIVTALPKIVVLPEFKRFSVSLKGGSERLAEGVDLNDITYKFVGGQGNSGPHEFRFKLRINGNSEQHRFVVDQTRPWEEQLRLYRTNEGYVELTFHHFNDGAGSLYFRIHDIK